MGEGRNAVEPDSTRQAEVLRAFKWSILGEAATRLIIPAVFLVLARLLTPEDFGVVAAAMVVISLCQSLADAGLGKALVRHRETLHHGANATFWLSICASLVMMAALVVAAPAIAGFFGDQRIASVVRVLSLQVPLAGLSTVPIALLQRQLGFRRLFWVRLVTAALPALASIPLATLGFGFWAIVAGTLVGQALQCISLWLQCSWRPTIRLDPSSTRQLLRFSRWTALSSLLAWSYGWLDSLVVARYLGSHDMGLYRIGNTFVTIVFGLCFSPLLPVLYSNFSRDGNDTVRVGSDLITSARTIVVLSLPLAALLVILSHQIEVSLFGQAWSGLAPLLALLAIAHGVAWLVGANGEAYRAVDRPDLETWVMGASIGLYLVGYLAAIRYGLIVFGYARVGLALVGLGMHVLIAGRLFGTGARPWLTALAKPASFTIIAAVAAMLLAARRQSEASAFISAISFLVIYLLLVACFDRQHLHNVRRALHGT